MKVSGFGFRVLNTCALREFALSQQSLRFDWRSLYTNMKYETRNPRLYTAILLFSTLFISSCKMNYSFSGATIPTEAKTVSVKYFDNQASLAGPMTSQSITEALRDIIQTQTNLRLTDKNADLSFEGIVTNYNTAPVAIQTNDQAALNRLTMTISVKYVNVFDEKKNFETTFSRFADFESSRSLAEVESQLVQEINKQLVQDVFNKAFNNW